jgi:hypothetical protein
MRDSREEILFNKYELRQVLLNCDEQLAKEIDGCDSNYILNVSVDEFSEYLGQKYRIEPVIIYRDKAHIKSHEETHVDVRYDQNRSIRDKSKPFYVKGTSITFAVPFEGDKNLFFCRGSMWSSSPPRAEIANEEVLITYNEAEPNPERIKADFESRIGSIESHLKDIIKNVESFNNGLKANAKGKIEARKTRILKQQGMVATLGYPIKVTSGIPKTYAVPEIKRKVLIKRPSATTTPFAPEPALDMENYEAILKIISDMVLVMERSPHAFKDMKEEDLRQQFLVPLNGHFEGEATGETFNYEGRTDILIRSGGKNIFIAECMIWRGEKYLLEKIDQLLGYTSWLDTKTAILIFNKGVDFTRVLSEIPEVAKKHNNFKRQLEYKSETGFRFIFAHKDDKNRELILTILAFNVPTGKETKS